MKVLYYILLLLSLTLVASCAKSPVYSFIDDYSQEDQTFSMTFPSWLVRNGTKNAFKTIGDDPDQQSIISLCKSLGEVRFLVAKKGVIPSASVNDLVKTLSANNFENYVSIRDRDKLINVMLCQEDKMIKELVVIISSEEEFVITNIQANLSVTDLEKLQISWNENTLKE